MGSSEASSHGASALGIMTGIGPRLRGLRAQRSMTLSQLSAHTGISRSNLSRIENSKRFPTLEQLVRLALAYRVPSEELLAVPGVADPRLHPRPSSRHGIGVLPLSTEPGGVQAYKLLVPVGDPEQQPVPSSHEGHNRLHVLSGRLRLVLAGEDVVLQAGDVADIDTRAPHWYTAVGSRSAELLVLVGVQGERMRLRVRAGRSSSSDGRDLPAS